ncbi:MAG TPA: hypothetical protein VI959_02745 [Alphaproteobacteria bacterium]|nr:hypothetical protein [Alphaproteobacteria bacterium]
MKYGIAAHAEFSDSIPDEEEATFYKKLLEIEEKLSNFLKSDLTGVLVTNLKFKGPDGKGPTNPTQLKNDCTYKAGQKNDGSCIRNYEICQRELWSYGKEAVEHSDNFMEFVSENSLNENSIKFAIESLESKISIHKNAIMLEQPKLLIKKARQELGFENNSKTITESRAVIDKLNEKIKTYKDEITLFKKIGADILEIIMDGQEYRNKEFYDHYKNSVKGF